MNNMSNGLYTHLMVSLATTMPTGLWAFTLGSSIILNIAGSSISLH